MPIWGERAITLQPIRAGFPCFGAAMAGYVEATIDGDEEKNRLCPPSPYSNTPADWARMQVLGTRATTSFASHPDIKAWADRVPLNPARIPPDMVGTAELTPPWSAFASVGPGMARMAELAGHVVERLAAHPVVQVNDTASETTLGQSLNGRGRHPAARACPTDDDRAEDKVAFVDQSCGDRRAGELGATTLMPLFPSSP